jgi:hypothetical protein
MTLAELVEAVNALPTNTARLDCAQHLRAFYERTGRARPLLVAADDSTPF